REQEYPDDIDEVPVKSGHFHRCVVFRAERILPGFVQKPGHDAEPDDHMQSMQTGHHKIHPEKYLHAVAEFVRIDLAVRKISGAFAVRQNSVARFLLQIERVMNKAY